MIALIRLGWSLMDPRVKRWIPWLLLAYLLLSALETFGISSIFPVMLLLIDPGSMLEIPLFAKAQEALGIAGAREMAGAMVALMAGALITKNLASILIYRWQIRFQQTAAARLSTDLYDRYLRMPYLASLERDASVLTYTVNALGGVLYSTFLTHLLFIVTESITVVLILAVLVYSNPIASSVAFVMLAAYGCAIYAFSSNRLREIGHINRKASEQAIRLIQEAFGGFKELRVLGRGGRFLDRFAGEWEGLANSQATQQLYVASSRFLIEIGVIASLSLFIWFTLSHKNLAHSIGQFGLFGAASLRVLPSIYRVLSAFQMLRTTQSPLELLRDEQAQIGSWEMEPPAAIRAPAPGREREPVHVSLDGVSFRYTGSREPAVDGIALDIPFGSSIGFAGRSGSGKTTTVDILLGVLKPSEGHVLANGSDIWSDIINWRRRVAYVPQQIAFVRGSILENVAFGLSPDEVDAGKVRAALEAAQMMRVVARLPQGIDTPVGEAGRLLSGGERQRLGIARALYQSASVLVLDEATSALDAHTEEDLSRLLRSLRGACTLVVVAHRLRTIRHCDRIALFDSGRLKAFAEFDTLVKTESEFAKMVELSQLKGEADSGILDSFPSNG